MNEQAFDWNSRIENDNNFVLIPPGVYRYTVSAIGRHHHGGSEKLPPCPKAEVTITIEHEDERHDVKSNLFLHPKCEGLLCAFFTSVGMRKSGEPLTMDFPGSIGRVGYAEISIRKYNDKEYNEVKKFLSPEEGAKKAGAPVAPATPPRPSRF